MENQRLNVRWPLRKRSPAGLDSLSVVLLPEAAWHNSCASHMYGYIALFTQLQSVPRRFDTAKTCEAPRGKRDQHRTRRNRAARVGAATTFTALNLGLFEDRSESVDTITGGEGGWVTDEDQLLKAIGMHLVNGDSDDSDLDPGDVGASQDEMLTRRVRARRQVQPNSNKDICNNKQLNKECTRTTTGLIVSIWLWAACGAKKAVQHSALQVFGVSSACRTSQAKMREAGRALP